MSASHATPEHPRGADPNELVAAVAAAERRLFQDVDPSVEERALGAPEGTLAAAALALKKIEAAARAAAGPSS